MKVSFTSIGSFNKTEAHLRAALKLNLESIVRSQAQRGADALSRATPVETGIASLSWTYEIKKSANSLIIGWKNTDIEDGYPVAVMIQYGHGTGTGGYVQGTDFINPAMRPIFESIAQTVWKAVISV